MMYVRASSFVLFALVLVAVSGCGFRLRTLRSSETNVDSPAPFPGVLHLLNSSSLTVDTFSLDPETGAPSLTPISSNPISVQYGWVTGIFFSPSGRYAYIPHDQDGMISQFDVDPVTGALVPMAAGDASGCAGIAEFSIDPGEKMAYLNCEYDGMIREFSIDPVDGSLSFFGPGYSPGDIFIRTAVSGDGRWLVALGSSVPTLVTLPIDPIDGSLGSAVTRLGLPSAGEIDFDPAWNYFYVHASPSEFDSYSLDEMTGGVSSSALPPTFFSSPVGRLKFAGRGLVYAGATSTNQIVALNSANGGLRPTPVVSPGDCTPRSLRVSLNGGYLYCLDSVSDTILTYAIHPTSGALREVRKDGLPAGISDFFVR